jgi:hypothetical protein
MKKPLLSEMSLREKINNMIILPQWDLRRRYENGEDYTVERPEKSRRKCSLKANSAPCMRSTVPL